MKPPKEYCIEGYTAIQSTGIRVLNSTSLLANQRLGAYTRFPGCLFNHAPHQLNELFAVTQVGLAVFGPDFTPERCLAKSWEVASDGRSIKFRLVDNATWHDGTPVTAEDVKWSLDRAVSARSLAPPQMSTGSITSPDQFRIAGPRGVEMMVERPDRLALPGYRTRFPSRPQRTL